MNELEKIRREKLKRLMEKIRDNKIQVRIEVDDNNFQERVIKQSKRTPVVVDFWAKWCMPCRFLTPVLEKLAEEYNGKFILAKVNIDESRITAQNYRIMSIPNVKMFKQGKAVDGFIGVLPEPLIKQFLNKNLR